jgi:hypothetical protein
MSLRLRPALQGTVLPDGRPVTVFVGVPEDPYIDQLELVVAEIRDERGSSLGVASTLLRTDDERGARSLARELATSLGTGEIEPTADGIEQVIDELA